MEPVYSVIVNAKGGREGSVYTEEGPLQLDLTTPALLGGKGQLRTNYLELFGASIAACYQNAVQQALMTIPKKHLRMSSPKSTS